MQEDTDDAVVTATHALADDIALYKRFPALRALPRAMLCTLPSPVEQVSGIEGAPIEIMASFNGSLKSHGLGILGGMLWSVGLISNLVAAAAEGKG